MRWCLSLGENVPHLPPSADQGIRNEGPVAPPGNCLGAHDGGPCNPAINHQLLQASPEFGGLHVIGISTEACAPPASVHRVRPALPTTAERRQMVILEAGFHQALRQ